MFFRRDVWVDEWIGGRVAVTQCCTFVAAMLTEPGSIACWSKLRYITRFHLELEEKLLVL